MSTIRSLSIHRCFIDARVALELHRANSFEDLAEIVLRILARIPSKVDMVSGAISTGGYNNRRKNLKLFASSIVELDNKNRAIGGRTVLSQMPFEAKIGQLARRWHIKNPGRAYCEPILDVFYAAIFSSGQIHTMHFLPNWRSSRGARWEYRVCPEFGIRRKKYSPELLKRALKSSGLKMWRRHREPRGNPDKAQSTLAPRSKRSKK